MPKLQNPPEYNDDIEDGIQERIVIDRRFPTKQLMSKYGVSKEDVLSCAREHAYWLLDHGPWSSRIRQNTFVYPHIEAVEELLAKQISQKSRQPKLKASK